MLATTMYIIISAYILGSISSAIVIAKLYKLPDPRTYGSKNPGTTNILRIGKKLPAVFTFLGDAGKGFIAVAIAKSLHLDHMNVALVMLVVFLGHLYPIFSRFQGGKGVATAFGIFLAFSWPLGLSLLSTWLLAVWLSKISAVGAIVAALVAGILGWLQFEPIYSATISVIVGLLLLRHRKNILQLYSSYSTKAHY